MHIKPILVHAHIYYPHLWAELKACLQNIALHPFDLFVTLVADHPDIETDIRDVFPAAHIFHVPNRGYDIGPFLEVLRRVNLADYSYVVKLHTKRDMPRSTSTFRGLTGPKWRETALSFLGTPEVFTSYLRTFEANPSIGMQANYRLIKREKGARFVAGTMFIARAQLFAPLKGMSFPFDADNAHTPQIAHALERRLGALAEEQGFLVTDAVNDPTEAKLKRLFFRDRFISPLLRFVYQKKMTKSGKIVTKLFKVPIRVRRKV